MAYNQELSSVKRVPLYPGDTSTISGLCDEVARQKLGGKLDVSAFQTFSSNAITALNGDYPVQCTDNFDSTYNISMDTLPLVPGNGIEFTEQLDSHGYTSAVAIECTGGGGQGGSTYTGISPIVVNNNTNQISAKGVPFGVQSPLYFVQDDNEAVVIGCSAGGGTGGDPEVENVVHTYSAAGTWLTAHQDISNLMPKSESANFYPMTGNPSGFLTEHQSLTNYYTKNETSSKQEISAAIANAGKTYTGVDPIVVNNVENKISADTWSFSAGEGLVFTDDNVNKVTKLEVEGESLSAGPNIDIFSSGGYVVISANAGGGGESFDPTYISGAVDTVSGAIDYISGVCLTSVDLTPYQTTANMTAYATTATTNSLSEQINEISGTLSGKHTLSAGEGIEFYEDDENNITRIDCTVTGGDSFDPTYISGAVDIVSGGVDYISGVCLTAHQSLADYQTTAGMTAYQDKLTNVNDIVLTASLPASPVANTLYLIPEA